MSADSPRRPRFCSQCGESLPEGTPRFCIECGAPVKQPSAPNEPAVVNAVPQAPVIQPVVGATVRLSNSNVEQAVIGGTIRLATDQAVPPGLWMHPHAPTPADTVAIYAPLRAIVGAWSGQRSAGWRLVDSQVDEFDDRGRRIFNFEIVRSWFPSPNYGENLELRIKIGAYSTAEAHETRRGFHFHPDRDSPMRVIEAWWVNAITSKRVERPLPIIQIMAPPRIPRVSDFQEGFANAKELGVKPEDWARRGQLPELFTLQNTSQTRTQVGRGLVLDAVRRPGGLFSRPWSGGLAYRVLAHKPLIILPNQWYPISERMRKDAKALGLDFGTEFEAEWWLDKQGYDAVVFEPSVMGENRVRKVIAFRRSQIMLDRS
jgi:hypothetical protein